MAIVETKDEELYTIHFSDTLKPLELDVDELVKIDSANTIFYSLDEAKGYLNCMFDLSEVAYGCVLKHVFHGVPNSDITKVEDDYMSIAYELYDDEYDTDNHDYS